MGFAIERTKKLAAVAALASLTAPTVSHEKSVSYMKKAPRIESFNWAGYVVEAKTKNLQENSVTDVRGEWTIPTLDCTDEDSTASTWVGIDGEASKTVEQIGNDYNCTNGEANYAVWYEMYPKYAVFIDFPVSAGDKMRAEVIYIGKDKYNLMLEDKTSGQIFSIVQKEPTAKRMSAEWIVESQNNTDLTQSDNIKFEEASVTMNGHTGTINDANWDPIPIYIANKKRESLASPVNLSSDGKSFEVQWQASR